MPEEFKDATTHLKSKLSIAKGEAVETQVWMELAASMVSHVKLFANTSTNCRSK